MKDLKRLLSRYYPLLLFTAIVCIFFYPFFLQGKVPLPADSIVGMYYPFRTGNGIPVKNPLITDPVRQQYVWRNLALIDIKKGISPLWNPYSFSGTPLLANFQSAPFYPLNIFFLILPFDLAWSILVFLEPLLAGWFLYLYLRRMKLDNLASVLGAISFAFSGFSVAWLTWNTVLHVVLWLPLIMLAKEHLLEKFSIKWFVILLFADISLFFAGHLQLLFYSEIISNLYLFLRIFQLTFTNPRYSRIFCAFLKKYTPFLFAGIIVLVVTSIQWIPTFQFIGLSARNFDQGLWTKPGWFIPWQNLIQFIIPDFFGNPSTYNYWGAWNYGEFVGFIGIIPLIFSLYAIFFRRDKKTFFFSSLVFVSLLFAFPTPVAVLPFSLNIPFISTSQPTRLIFIIDFALSILVALGLDKFLKDNNIKKLVITLLPIGVFFIFIWLLIFGKPSMFNLTASEILIIKRNSYLPTAVFILGGSILFLFSIKKTRFVKPLTLLLILLTSMDLLRFAWKFTPFSSYDLIFPPIKLLTRLQKEPDNYRVMSTDRRIMPPNFSVYYRLQDVSGYDPLYIKRYGELVAAWNRGRPDIAPASFNRILTPQNYQSPLADLLGVKYILSLTDENSPKLKFLEREGETRLYENTKVLPRVFLVNHVLKAFNDQDEINKLFSISDGFDKNATSQENIRVNNTPLTNAENAQFITYSDNGIKIKVTAKFTRLLILTDINYPIWHAFIDGQQTSLYTVDYVFRGVVIPSGNHLVEFQNSI